MLGVRVARLSIVLLLFVGLCASEGNASPINKLETPGFTVGSYEAKNALIFVWSADSKESSQYYLNVVLPLKNEINSRQLQIIFFQFNKQTENDIGTGPLILCAKDKYPDLAMEYLIKFDGNFVKSGNWSVSSVLSEIGPQFGLPKNVTACHKGKEGRLRRERLASMTRSIKSQMKATTVPLIFLNGKPITLPATSDDIRKNLK